MYVPRNYAWTYLPLSHCTAVNSKQHTVTYSSKHLTLVSLWLYQNPQTLLTEMEEELHKYIVELVYVNKHFLTPLLPFLTIDVSWPSKGIFETAPNPPAVCIKILPTPIFPFFFFTQKISHITSRSTATWHPLSPCTVPPVINYLHTYQLITHICLHEKCICWWFACACFTLLSLLHTDTSTTHTCAFDERRSRGTKHAVAQENLSSTTTPFLCQVAKITIQTSTINLGVNSCWKQLDQTQGGLEDRLAIYIAG